jgi:2-methylcitrate dehydratase PrpD
VEDVFSGKYNFFSTFAPAADFAPAGDQSKLTSGLGRDYAIMRGAVKRWSTGGPTQAPMHVLYELIKEHGIKAQDVEKVVVSMPAKNLLTVDNRAMANISLQHLVALMLVDGTLTFKSSHDYKRMKDKKVQALRSRIEAVGIEEPPTAVRSWRSAVEITLKDGRKLANETTAAKGTYENPMTRQDADEKALDLIAPVLGKRKAQQLLTKLWDFDRVKDVRTLRKLVTA